MACTTLARIATQTMAPTLGVFFTAVVDGTARHHRNNGAAGCATRHEVVLVAGQIKAGAVVALTFLAGQTHDDNDVVSVLAAATAATKPLVLLQ